MTKKELLEAIKDMPENAEIFVYDYNWHWGILEVNMLNTPYGKEIILKLEY